MFNNVSPNDLVRDELYLERALEYRYSLFGKYLVDMLNTNKDMGVWDRSTPEDKSELVWWLMNESWEGYAKMNHHLPLYWISLIATLLQFDFLPRNVFNFGRSVIGALDLEKYMSTHAMPCGEAEALRRDYEVCLHGLNSYPLERLGPDVPEDAWGYSDQ